MALRSQASLGKGPGTCDVWDGMGLFGVGAASALNLLQSACGVVISWRPVSSLVELGAIVLPFRFL